MFIAAWYLMRFGRIGSELYPKYLVADKILNILPESFKPFEDKGLQIIASTKHDDVLVDIAYEFLPGRLISE